MNLSPRTKGIVCAAVGLGGLCLTGAAAGDWPQWRGPNRDGVSAETGWLTTWPADGPKVAWKKNVGSGYSGVAVVGDRLYTAGNIEGFVKTADVIYCLDVADGKEIWKQPYDSAKGAYGGPRATPTVDGDCLFMLSRHGDLLCLAVTNGSVKWRKNVRADFGVGKEPHEWGLSCSPLVLGDKLILDLGKLLVLNKADGARLSSLGDDGPGFSSPVAFDLGGQSHVTSFNQFGLVLYNLTANKEIGRAEWKAKYLANVATPVVDGGRIFISSGYGRGCALFQASPEGLKPLYQNTNLSSECVSGVLHQGCLYSVSGEQGNPGSLKCLDFATGQVKWEHAGFKVGGGLTIADGKILHLADNGQLTLVAAAPDAYQELARAKVLGPNCWTQPVLANGRIYCRNHKGDLVCLDVRGQ
jgi:outer membrane protein assembly factor BamB